MADLKKVAVELEIAFAFSGIERKIIKFFFLVNENVIDDALVDLMESVDYDEFESLHSVFDN